MNMTTVATHERSGLPAGLAVRTRTAPTVRTGNLLVEMAATLDVPPMCVARLVAAGFIDFWTPGHIARTDAETLARRPYLDVAALGGGAPVVALHVGPTMADTTYSWRRFVGIDLANRNDLGEYGRTLAWTTGWDMTRAQAQALVGGIAVADVSSFLSADYAMRVLAFDQVNGPHGRTVRLYGVPLESHEAALVDGHRTSTKCNPSGTWERLAPTVVGEVVRTA